MNLELTDLILRWVIPGFSIMLFILGWGTIRGWK
jgi:hypothetical protein